MSYAREKNFLNFKLRKIAPTSANIYRLINLTLKSGDVLSITHSVLNFFYIAFFIPPLSKFKTLKVGGGGGGHFPRNPSLGNPSSVFSVG